MQYGAVMNKDELIVSLLMMGENRLSDVIETPEGYKPSEETIADMVRKGFLVEDEQTGNPDYNDFVYMVLWTAVHAESELRINAQQGLSCRLFFQGDTMILLTYGTDAPYVLHFLSVIPQAIGGIASTLSWLEEPMDAASKQSAPASDVAPAQMQLDIRGLLFGEPDMVARLDRAGNGFVYRWNSSDGDAGTLHPGYYEFIQKLIPWVVKAHGRSIVAKEENDGEL